LSKGKKEENRSKKGMAKNKEREEKEKFERRKETKSTKG
jgi:hypothetical protein